MLFGRSRSIVVLMDVSMPGMGGLTALEELIKLDPEAVVLMITAYATFDTAISAWEKGASGRDPQTVSERANPRLRRHAASRSGARKRNGRPFGR